MHLFLPEQPDLNWSNPEVVEAMHGVLRFWLDRGVDGFRADVVHLIGRDTRLASVASAAASAEIVSTHDHPKTHDLLRGVRRVLAEYGADRIMVGEVPLASRASLARYYGVGDELDMVFDFALMHVPWSADAFRAAILETEAVFGPSDLWPCWVLSNHDQPRHRTRFGGSEPRARAAAVVLLTLRGTPCLYAGEELGLLDADVPPAARVDPGARDGSRAPIPWDPRPGHGWPTSPWLPFPPQPEVWNLESEDADPGSILALYRRLSAARRASPALALGGFEFIPSPPDTLVYERTREGDVRRIAVNFADTAGSGIAVDGPWKVEVTSGATREGGAWDGVLGAAEAVILGRD